MTMVPYDNHQYFITQSIVITDLTQLITEVNLKLLNNHKDSYHDHITQD